jgi:hypothetical protein
VDLLFGILAIETVCLFANWHVAWRRWKKFLCNGNDFAHQWRYEFERSKGNLNNSGMERLQFHGRWNCRYFAANNNEIHSSTIEHIGILTLLTQVV